MRTAFALLIPLLFLGSFLYASIKKVRVYTEKRYESFRKLLFSSKYVSGYGSNCRITVSYVGGAEHGK